MPTTKRRPDQPCNTLPAHRWLRTRALKDVCQLNEYLLEVLSVLAALGRPTSLDVVTRHADLWRLLDATARRRAAQIPVLLLDLNFQDETWWQGVVSTANARLTDPQRPEPGVRSLVARVHAGSADACLADRSGGSGSRESAVWHVGGRGGSDWRHDATATGSCQSALQPRDATAMGAVPCILARTARVIAIGRCGSPARTASVWHSAAGW